MKNLLLVLVILTFFACKKDDPDPVVVTPDYADSLVGTYIGHEIRFDSDNNTKLYEDVSKTMTIVKLDKNRIQLKTFYQGPMPIFNLSDRGDGNIKLTPEGMVAHGTGNNEYFLSDKRLYIYVKDGIPWYYYFQGDKQ